LNPCTDDNFVMVVTNPVSTTIDLPFKTLSFTSYTHVWRGGVHFLTSPLFGYFPSRHYDRSLFICGARKYFMDLLSPPLVTFLDALRG